MNVLRGLTFDDVLLVPGYNGIRSRQDVSTRVSLKHHTFEIPVASANMDKITEVEMANALGSLGGLSILHRFMPIDSNVYMFKSCKYQKNTGFSVGIGNDALLRAEALTSAGAEIVCVDVAHGHSKEVNRTIKHLKEIYRDNLLIIAGNVATYAGADYLAAAGADVIKVGIGPGSVCTTRVKTGYGVPQLTAILECKKVDRPLIADGGIKTPGDAVKAFAAGADFIMLGGMLAGTDETPGKIEEIYKDGKSFKFKVFRGMASKEAQDDFMGKMAEWKTAEGVSVEIPCKGPVKNIIQDVVGGLRSGLTYSGATDIKSLQRKAQFIEVSQAGYKEGTPHAIGRLT